MRPCCLSHSLRNLLPSADLRLATQRVLAVQLARALLRPECEPSVNLHPQSLSSANGAPNAEPAMAMFPTDFTLLPLTPGCEFIN